MIMNDAIKARAGIVYNVVEATILAVTVGLTTWTAKTVIEHGNSLGIISTRELATESRVDRIESKGSASLETHIKEADAKNASMNSRVDKLETAVIGLQSAPGELKAIGVRLDNLRDGQQRIEKMFEDHLKNTKP